MKTLDTFRIPRVERVFLEKWKPFASLPPSNAVRQSILRLLGTEDAAERAKILVKVNDLNDLRLFR